MQGSYKTNGLPRPYYMKPHKRGVYENMARLTHLTNSRKLMGYLLMLVLFGLCMYMIGQELRGMPSSGYEIVGKNVPKTPSIKENMDGDVKNFVQSGKNKDKVTEKDALANGKKEASGDFDNVVDEAPMGGLVNEAPIVGNDAGLVIDGKKSSGEKGTEKKVPAKAVKGAKGVVMEPKQKKGTSFSASREEDVEDDAVPPRKAEAKTPPAEDVKAKVIKKGKALDTQREGGKKKGVDSEAAQRVVDETEDYP